MGCGGGAMSKNYSTASDVTSKQPAHGPGLQSMWRCMGCNVTRPNLGSRGAGVRKRCASCLEAKGKA